ncbi:MULTISPECIES: long-chain-acyl-CoA synthetase [unclassified Moritella]|uniref:long-chain-acyl-CoA synthetase n=1 Tax=unclassified Moritella TaxID=2637987 RepID=UPI001BA79CB9|nr:MULTISPECIES: long-chain-acyl-CoA synthetase [unclassified Moritella]QUM85265.1 long-chain-acyl-CoA synthetase [Moritella sp. 28]QUM89489.1 long-chain-acyl-CoA synthetase [Moritella sp. 36]
MTVITGKQLFKSTINILKTPKPILKGLWHLQKAKPERYMSIGLLLEEQAIKNSSLIAIQFKEQRYSYEELNNQANQYANYLHEYGISQSDKVAIMLDNRPETIIIALAVVKLGAIACMINTTQKNAVLEHSLTVVDTKLIIADEIYHSTINDIKEHLSPALQKNIFYIPALKSAEHPIKFKDISKLVANYSVLNPDTTPKIQLKNSAFYIFTSGTTGLPKAAKMSHHRWFKSMSGMGMASLRLTSDDVLYLSLPLYHNNALTVSLSAVFGNAATLALSEKFSSSRFWDEIRDHNATAFTYIGELCRYLLNVPTKDKDKQHGIKKIIGNGLRPEIWDEFQQRFGIEHINEFYGASECNLVFTNALNLPHTAGITPLAFTVVEYDIDNDEPLYNEKGKMIKVKTGAVGLLLTRITKRSPFDGYTDDKESNKKLFKSVLKDGDCYFNTGDLVKYQGFRHISFVDRLGDTFRWKGENVATTQVEGQLNEFNQVDQTVAYGVELPHHDGRAGMVALTLNCPIHEFSTADFFQHVTSVLPSYAQPIFVRLREKQEITGTFKYKKTDLKKESYYPNISEDLILIKQPKQNSYTALDENTITAINEKQLSF